MIFCYTERVFFIMFILLNLRSFLTHLMYDSDVMSDVMTSTANYSSTSTTQSTIPPMALRIQVAHRVIL